MIVVTGAAGFIGSCLANFLYREGYKDLLLVDDFSKERKLENLARLDGVLRVEREEFHDWLDQNHMQVQAILHMGARTDTTEFDVEVFNHLNLNYTKKLWKQCVEFGLPLIYASSAATYGGGENGYQDTHEVIPKLQPLNPYGESKNQFDLWALEQERAPYFWIGLKFFNVYGPNESHKGRMASVVYHAFNQFKETGKVKLFKSHRSDYGDGMQERDFVYVKDVVQVIQHFLGSRNPDHSGIYNLGTGRAQTFLDLVNGIFDALNEPPVIEFVDTPIDIRDKYQYFTEASMDKLRNTGYTRNFMDLKEGVGDYVLKHLVDSKPF